MSTPRLTSLEMGAKQGASQYTIVSLAPVGVVVGAWVYNGVHSVPRVRWLGGNAATGQHTMAGAALLSAGEAAQHRCTRRPGH